MVVASVIPALGRLREESHFKFGVRLGYILFLASMCWRQEYLLSKMKKKKKLGEGRGVVVLG